MMRSEEEMFNLLLSYAKADERIRAVILNGSRVNPNAKKDPFQDYDVVYLVTDVASFRGNQELVKYFGEIMILQTPDDMGDPPPENEGHYAYLMQFMDGTRIDLSFFPIEEAKNKAADSLSLVLLDKDGLLPALPPPSENSYLPERPTAKQFADCCNEFWWLNPYVAKGLWRGELTLTKQIFEVYLRPQFLKMLTWYFGVQTGFEKSAGKVGKNIKYALPADVWAAVEKTYPDANPDHIWDSLFMMGDLFRQFAFVVSDAFDFDYPAGDDERVSAFIRHVRELPPEATSIY